MNILKYKTYVGSSEVSFEDQCLHGKILFIQDLVTYEAQTVRELEMEFQSAVDDYLETCNVLGKAPDKTFTGTFQIRVGTDIHRQAAIAAKGSDVSLNEWVGEAIAEKLDLMSREPSTERSSVYAQTGYETEMVHEPSED